MNPVLENARPSDFPAIGSLNVAAYRDFAPYMTPEAWERVAANLSRPEGAASRAQFIMARVDGEIAGSVAYCPAGRSVDPIPAEWASVLLLAVSPDHRGSGLGEALTRECLRRAREDGASVIGLFTSERMLAARRIYEKLGFSRESEIPPRNGMRYWRYGMILSE